MADTQRGRQQSASTIAQQLSTATGRQVSRFTVARCLHKGGLFARRSERCLPLKVGHRRHRLQWCREPKNWATDQWSRVLLTNESQFSTRSDSQHVLIWREIGTRFCPSNIKERHRYGGPGVLVWGGIMLNGRIELHIFDRGSVTEDRYCEEVLLTHVRLFRGAIGPDFIFMDDNAQPHRTLAVEELLESEYITRMDWAAYSPDLNPIEHIWDALGRRIAARLHYPENTQQLKQMLIEEWALLPQEMLHQQDLSMRRRCKATIASNLVVHDTNPNGGFGGRGSTRNGCRVSRCLSARRLAMVREDTWIRSEDVVCFRTMRKFGLAIHQNDHQARRRFVEWAQNEIAVVPDIHKRILFSDKAHFWLNGYVNKQNCRIWSEANPQVYVETPLHPEKLTVWCALWAGGILLQKR
ncbi:transposable element Tc1 transposase [Trichonephila clavipes]|nr:transposable element Tc1 transposase [Trichonephila clavipes]